jgi:hypothetical protein
MASLAKYDGKLYRLIKLTPKLRWGENAGKRRANLAPLDGGEAIWVDGDKFSFVDYVPKGAREK